MNLVLHDAIAPFRMHSFSCTVCSISIRFLVRNRWFRRTRPQCNVSKSFDELLARRDDLQSTHFLIAVDWYACVSESWCHSWTRHPCGRMTPSISSFALQLETVVEDFIVSWNTTFQILCSLISHQIRVVVNRRKIMSLGRSWICVFVARLEQCVRGHNALYWRSITLSFRRRTVRKLVVSNPTIYAD